MKREKLSVAGELAAGVAHEIRNPITAIKGFVQMMHNGTFKESYYEIMLTEFDHIETVINEFLLLAKPQVIHFKQTDISRVLIHAIAPLKSQGILKNIQFKYDCEKKLPLIIADENQIKQVFMNLLINAMESMSSGGEIQVVANQKDTNWIIIQIIDQGCGMTEDRLEKLGEPFYSTKEKGVGLGLVFSYKIIDEHQGKIYIKSKIDLGTLIEVWLPVNQTPISPTFDTPHSHEEYMT